MSLEGVLLLASDGLHRHLSHEEIHAWIDPVELAEVLNTWSTSALYVADRMM